MTVTDTADDPIVIVSATRTPIGHFLGAFQTVPATTLGATAIAGALKTASLKPDQIDEVFFGCVLPAGLGQAPARQAALAAGLSQHTPCTTVNKVCGSGMQTVLLAHDRLRLHPDRILIAGGMENMSRAPYLSLDARNGMRYGHKQLLDHLLHDGLQDAYHDGQSMGLLAEACAEKFKLSRQAQDAFAIRSVERAQYAQKNDCFKDEITPVIVPGKRGKSSTTVSVDEGPQLVNTDKVPQLKPAFKQDGTITAANASSISDGAAALVLMRASKASALKLTPLAKIKAHTTYAHAPEWFTTAPIEAIRTLLNTLNWQTDDVDLFEINEAFAVVTLAALQALALDPEKVNVHGGACVLGHPIGASGTRIIVTLVHALHRLKKQRGIAALCIGGGEATAIAIET